MADEKQIGGTGIESAASSTTPSTTGGASTQAGASPETASKGYSFGGKTYGSVDELGKAYEAANAELGRWTQQHGDLKRQYDQVSRQAQQWGDWWKNVQPLWGDDVEAFLRQKMLGKSPQGQQGQAQRTESGATSSATSFDGYELLTPQEQAARMRENLLSELTPTFNQRMAELAQAVNSTLQQKEQWYQNYLQNHLGLLRRALETKLSNPNFDVDKVMEQAAKALAGQIDPIELGQQLLSASTAQSQIEAAKKDAYELAKKDFELAQQNKQMESLPGNTAVPRYAMPNLPTPGMRRNGLASMRQSAAEAMAKRFGPGIFANE